MEKIKCDTLIISRYDGGVNFSIAIDDKVITGFAGNFKENTVLFELYKAYCYYPYNFIKLENILTHNFDCRRIIECDNGDITIKFKGEK